MITVDRAKTILASYGGDSSLWPEHEHMAMQVLLAKSSTLRALQSEALSLDQLITISVDKQNDIKEQQYYSKLIAQTVSSLPKQSLNKQALLLRVKNMFLGITDMWFEQTAFIKPVAISLGILLCVLTLLNPFNDMKPTGTKFQVR